MMRGFESHCPRQKHCISLKREGWIKNYKKSNASLSEEIEDTKASLDNENIWLLGSKSDEEISGHLENITNLQDYLDWLLQQNAA